MYLSSASVISLLLIGLVIGAEIPLQHKENSDKSEFKKSLEKECATSYSPTCLKLDIVQWVDKLSDSKDLSVLPGVTIVKENNVQEKANVVVARLAREFPNDPESRLDAYLMKKITGYLGSHSIRLNLFDAKAAEDAFTGRKKGGFGGGGGGKDGKKGDGLGMLLMAGGMMKATLFAVGLGALAALAGKALMTGLISLMLSAIVGLKSLSGGGHHSTTYEVISKPIHTSHHSQSFSHEDHGGHGGGGGGGHGGWSGRSFQEPIPAGLQPDFKPY